MSMPAPCTRSLLHLAQSEHDAQDVLQGVFCALAAKPKILAGVKNVRSFLLRMAHRRLIDVCAAQSSAGTAPGRAAGNLCSGGGPGRSCFSRSRLPRAGCPAAEQRSVVHLKLWENSPSPNAPRC